MTFRDIMRVVWTYWPLVLAAYLLTCFSMSCRCTSVEPAPVIAPCHRCLNACVNSEVESVTACVCSRCSTECGKCAVATDATVYAEMGVCSNYGSCNDTTLCETCCRMKMPSTDCGSWCYSELCYHGDSDGGATE